MIPLPVRVTHMSCNYVHITHLYVNSFGPLHYSLFPCFLDLAPGTPNLQCPVVHTISFAISYNNNNSPFHTISFAMSNHMLIHNTLAHIRTRAHTCTHTHAYTLAHTHTYAHTHTGARSPACAHTHACAHMHTYARI